MPKVGFDAGCGKGLTSAVAQAVILDRNPRLSHGLDVFVDGGLVVWRGIRFYANSWDQTWRCRRRSIASTW